MRLRRAVELAQRIGEAAGHRQDAAGLVLQHHAAPCTVGRRAQLRATALLALLLDELDPDHIIKLEIAPRRIPGIQQAGRGRRRGSDLQDIRPGLPVLALFDHDGSRPLHVVERQARRLQSLPPRWNCSRILCIGLRIRKRLDRTGEVGFRALIALAADAQLVACEPLLQGGLGRLLQSRVDGGAHRIGPLRSGPRYRRACAHRDSTWSTK